MKKNGLRRLLSMVAAVALTANTMTVMAFAAPSGGYVPAGTAGTSGVQDIYQYTHAEGNALPATATQITDFEADKDWLVVKVPTGVTYATTTDGTTTTVTLTKTAGTTTAVGVTVNGSVVGRVVPVTQPLLRSATASKTTAEQGETVTITAVATDYDGSSNGVTYSIDPATNITANGGLFTLNTTGMSGKTDYTVTATVNGTAIGALPVSVTVNACVSAVSGVTVTPPAAGQNKFTATVSFSPQCANTAHNDAGVTWSLTNAPAGVAISADGVLSIPQSLPVQEYSMQVTATSKKDTTKVATVEYKFTPAGTCDATLTGGTVSSTDAAGNAVTLPYNTAKTLTYTFKPEIASTVCNQHAAGSDHGITSTVVWTLENPPAEVSINATTGVLSIGGTVPTTNLVVKATVTASKQRTTPTVASAPLNITRQSAPVVCNKQLTGISLTPTGNTLTVATGGTATQTVTPNFTFTGECNDPAHTAPNSPHKVVLTWSAYEQDSNPVALPAGVTFANGVLTVTESAMLNTKLSANLVVTAAAQNGTTSMSAVANTLVTRPVRCTKGLGAVDDATAQTNMGSPTPGAANGNNQLQFLNNNTVAKLVVKDTTATLTFNMGKNGAGVLLPILTGNCEFSPNNEANCPNAANHRVTWSLDKNYSGIAIDPATGTLTVTRKSLTNVESSVGVRATLGGVGGTKSYTKTGFVVVRNDNYYNDNTTEEDREEDRKSEQWEDLEYDINDADSKDVIKVNLGNNSEMPFYVVRELTGKNVTVELNVGNGYTWVVNGRDLKTLPQYQIYIPLGVERLTDSKILKLAKERDILAFELEHNDSFYGTYRLRKNVGSDYANKYVYLYKYNESTKKLMFKGSYKVNADGDVLLPFTSASSYVLTNKGLNGEAAGSGGTTSGGGASVSVGGGGTTTPPASSKPASSASASPSSSSSSSSSSSESVSSQPESIPESSSSEISRPTDVEPEEPEQPAKKSIPIIVPILIAVVVLTIVAVVLLAKGGGMNFGG